MEELTCSTTLDYEDALETVVDIHLFGEDHPTLRMSQREADAIILRSFQIQTKSTDTRMRIPYTDKLLPKAKLRTRELPDTLEKTREFLNAYIFRLDQGHALMILRDCEIINFPEAVYSTLQQIERKALDRCEELGEKLRSFSMIRPGPGRLQDILDHALLQMKGSNRAYVISPDQMTTLMEAAKVFNINFGFSRATPQEVAIASLCQLNKDVAREELEQWIEFMHMDMLHQTTKASFILTTIPDVASQQITFPPPTTSLEMGWARQNSRIRREYKG